MGESLRVDSDLLRALAPELAELADMAYKELTQLKATLAAEGQCWGNDEPGRTFGESYEPDAEQGLAGYSNLIDNLRRTSAGVADAADAFHSEDQYIGNQLRDLDPVDVHPAWHDPIPVFDQPAWPGSDLSPESLPPTVLRRIMSSAPVPVTPMPLPLDHNSRSTNRTAIRTRLINRAIPTMVRTPAPVCPTDRR